MIKKNKCKTILRRNINIDNIPICKKKQIRAFWFCKLFSRTTLSFVVSTGHVTMELLMWQTELRCTKMYKIYFKYSLDLRPSIQPPQKYLINISC